MNNELKELIELANLTGPSGQEYRVARYLEPELVKYGYEIKHDALGNLIALKKSKVSNAPTLALFAHMDEVGYMVKEICNDGTLRGYALGGINPDILPTTRMCVLTSTGNTYKGMIRGIPPHLKDVATQTEYIFDFGFNSKEEAIEAGIAIADPMVFDEDAYEIANGKSVLGKAIDDRAGCAALLKCAKYVSEYVFDYNLYFVFTTQEEVGTRGATAAAYAINPDLAIVCDISPTMKEYGHRGKGVLIRHADRNMVSFPRLIKFEKELFEENNIKHQDYISLGGTDAGAIHLTREGVPTLTMCLVAESIHSPSAIVDVNDYLSLVESIKTLLTKVDGAKIRHLKEHD